MKALAPAMVFLAAALCGTAAHAAESDDMLAVAQAIYAPYVDPSKPMITGWNYPFDSSALAALTAEWEKGLSSDEVEDLNDFDWFCQCQDSDPANSHVEYAVEHEEGSAAGVVDVQLDIGLGKDDVRESKLLFVNEGGKWLLDDIVSDAFPDGLKAELRKAIAAHRKLS